MARFDLHTHTDCSDGTTSPEQLVAEAAALGLDGLAITDHDTLAGVDRATAAAEGVGVEVIGGVELSAEHDGYSVHVLGYWPRADDQALAEEMDRLRNERERRAAAIVERFREHGVAVTLEQVRAIAGDAPIARPHIARAVVDVGAAGSAQEVFDTWLADGGPAYVEKHAVTPARAVELLRAAGAAVVLAHPGLWGARDGTGGIDESVVEAMADVGMAGLEADHPDHTDEQRRRYRRLAEALGLVVTAGSDHHGTAKPNPLGSATVDRRVVDQLRERRPSAGGP